VVGALLAGSLSPSGARGPVIAALGLAMGVVLTARARTTASRLHPHVLAIAVLSNALAAAAVLSAPYVVVAATITAAAAFAMGIVSERDPVVSEPVVVTPRRRIAPGAAHSRLVDAVAADPDRTALLLADGDILDAVRARCGELEGEDLLREVAVELAAAGRPLAPTPPAPRDPAPVRTPEHV
jgi:hypothetical protein